MWMSHKEDKWTWLVITQEWAVNTRQGSRVNWEYTWTNNSQEGERSIPEVMRPGWS